MIVSKVSTSVKGDDQVKKFLSIIKQAKKSYVTVGVHDGAGSYEGGSPMVCEVALWTEFGTKYSPERSWMRSCVDENEGKLNALREKLMGDIMEGKKTVRKALEEMGFFLQVLLQNKIKSNVPPDLAESTKLMKKRAGVAPVTLINTGLLLRSITYKVVVGAA